MRAHSSRRETAIADPPCRDSRRRRDRRTDANVIAAFQTAAITEKDADGSVTTHVEYGKVMSDATALKLAKGVWKIGKGGNDPNTIHW